LLFVMVDRGSVDDLTINLRQQLMVNQFQTATGCSHDQAEQLLLSSRWQFQPALSLFFEEYNPSINTSNSSCPSAAVDKAYAPCNTPVTPPSLSETMMAFQQLHAIDDWMSRSPPSSVCFASSSHSSPMSGFTALTPTFIQSSGLRSANNDVGFSFAGQAVTEILTAGHRQSLDQTSTCLTRAHSAMGKVELVPRNSRNFNNTENANEKKLLIFFISLLKIQFKLCDWHNLISL
ncbi:UBA-like domain-containing protein 2-A, partial [Trichinella spiralis]